MRLSSRCMRSTAFWATMMASRRSARPASARRTSTSGEAPVWTRRRARWSRAWARSNLYTGVELTNWHVDIPHDDVAFASGKWDVSTEEAVKLEASFKLIQDAVEKYGSLAQIRLFVVGFTDTVGPTASNRTLSFNRARSIGAWFRKRGLRIPVLVEGLGEEALLVGTPDEQDEPKNRRALYVIAIDDPPLRNAPFPPKWQRL